MNALAAIHVAKKQLGLDDETYRAVLMRVAGKASAGDMTEAERQRVVDELRRQGFKRAGKGLEGPFAKKLQALWIAAWNLGLVRDRRDVAMLSFVKRQTGIEHTRFLRDPADARKAVEALKGWMAREAKVDWTDGDHKPAWQRLPGAKIALAQWDILHPDPPLLDPEAGFGGFRRFVEERAFNPLPRMTAREWAGIMNTLGERIRAMRR
jgi:hypothetical protein